MQIFEVRATWDREAGVWWARSDDVPGLVAEAETVELLRNELVQLIPELLSANGRRIEGAAQMRLVTEDVEDLCAA